MLYDQHRHGLTVSGHSALWCAACIVRAMASTHPEPSPPDPYASMADEQVLEVAKTALLRAEKHPPRSATRKVQLAVFDAAMSELARRAMAHVLWKIHERER
jgi:hypothetical protein